MVGAKLTKLKNEYGCCSCGKKPKKIPYGSKRVKFWCGKCDAGLVSSISKKRERQKVKKEIKKAKE